MIKFLFVYNAKSGKVNALLDAGHKLFSPKTYQCDLCALTFDTFSENKKWKAFRSSSQIDMKFYHIDEFEVDHPDASFEYPVVIRQNGISMVSVLSKDDFKAIRSVDELISRLSSEINHLK